MDTQGSSIPQQTAEKIYNIASIENATFVTQSATIEAKPFNEYLTKELLEALQPYSEFAVRAVSYFKDKPDWNKKQSKNNDQAKDIIVNSYLSVLGISKLISIGKDTHTDPKILITQYIDNSVQIATRAFQIICFTFLSDLWNLKKENENVCTLSEDEEKTIANLFDAREEIGIIDYLNLFKILYTIYIKSKLDLPIEELIQFEPNLATGSKLCTACEELDRINTVTTGKYTPENCLQIEKNLTDILASLNFLAAYKMVSIKEIAYEGIRNTNPRFLHNYISLDTENKPSDSSNNEKKERLNYRDEPINTDSVLLYKGDFNRNDFRGINLFPFIIDYNALTLEGGIMISFYSCGDMSSDNIIYFKVPSKDNKNQEIEFTDAINTIQKTKNIEEDIEYRIKVKLDGVFQQFNQAKKTILGIVDLGF